MKVFITGAEGFIAKNFIVRLQQNSQYELLLCDRNTSVKQVEEYIRDCDIIFHLAGVNRIVLKDMSYDQNIILMKFLLECMKKYKKHIPIVYSSSIQAEQDNPYGISKKNAEDMLCTFAKKNEQTAIIYRLPNVFGKWCKPNYNSVIATFCYNIQHNLPIEIHNPQTCLSLVYIDDVIDDFMQLLSQVFKAGITYRSIEPIYHVTLHDIVEYIYEFKKQDETISVSSLQNGFIKKLWSTFVSYRPASQLANVLVKHKDQRGWFAECIHMDDGQVSISISKPGVIRGQHWHDTKVERFLVIQGKALVQLRKINTSEATFEYVVSDEKLESIIIPPGYTHKLQNIGSNDLITIIWSNEVFDPNDPDTYGEEV